MRGRGVLKPAQKHLFRAEFNNMTTKLAGTGEVFPAQVVSVRCKYGKERLIELVLREDASGLLLGFLDDLMKDTHLVFKLIRVIDNKDGPSEIFDGVQIESRSCEWTYFEGEPVEHLMVLTYESVRIEK